MKVAFLTHEPFYPPSGGGSAEALYLVQEMVQRGHEVHVFCPSFPEPANVERMLAALPEAGPYRKPTPAPSQPPSRRSGALARREGGEGNRSGGRTSFVGGAAGGLPGSLQCHLFTTWQMSRYTSLRNFKYIAYPYFLERLVERMARQVRFELILSQHAISAVAAGRLKQRLRVPVVMNFLD